MAVRIIGVKRRHAKDSSAAGRYFPARTFHMCAGSGTVRQSATCGSSVFLDSRPLDRRRRIAARLAHRARQLSLPRQNCRENRCRGRRRCVNAFGTDQGRSDIRNGGDLSRPCPSRSRRQRSAYSGAGRCDLSRLRRARHLLSACQEEHRLGSDDVEERRRGRSATRYRRSRSE
jgi:hypothetical protein